MLPLCFLLSFLRFILIDYPARNQSLLAMDDMITFLARLERIKEKTAPC